MDNTASSSSSRARCSQSFRDPKCLPCEKHYSFRASKLNRVGQHGASTYPKKNVFEGPSLPGYVNLRPLGSQKQISIFDSRFSISSPGWLQATPVGEILVFCQATSGSRARNSTVFEGRSNKNSIFKSRFSIFGTWLLIFESRFSIFDTWLAPSGSCARNTGVLEAPSGSHA